MTTENPSEMAQPEANPAIIGNPLAAEAVPTPPAPVATVTVTEENTASVTSTMHESGGTETSSQAVTEQVGASTDNGASSTEGGNKQWYVVKVQSGREETVKEAIERRVKIEGLEPYFGQIVVPMEREVVTIQSGKRKGQKTVRKKKKFPGYIMAQVELNERMLYLFRETSGVGDFVGASQHRKPLPMSEREVAAMLRDQEDVKGIVPAVKETKKRGGPVKLPFNVGDKVRVREGIFSGQEGEIKEIREPKDETETHRISVELTVFGRPTRVQLEHWQIESV